MKTKLQSDGTIMPSSSAAVGCAVATFDFSWKENPPKEIEGKELMLIIHQEGKYYVVEKQKPAPEYPEVYIIPDNQIKLAVMKKSPYSRLNFLLSFAKNDT